MNQGLSKDRRRCGAGPRLAGPRPLSARAGRDGRPCIGRGSFFLYRIIVRPDDVTGSGTSAECSFIRNPRLQTAGTLFVRRSRSSRSWRSWRPWHSWCPWRPWRPWHSWCPWHSWRWRAVRPRRWLWKAQPQPGRLAAPMCARRFSRHLESTAERSVLLATRQGSSTAEGKRRSALRLHTSRSRAVAPFLIYVPDVKVFGGSIGAIGVAPYGAFCGRLFAAQRWRCAWGAGDPYVEVAWSRYFGTPRASSVPGSFPCDR